MQKQSIAIIIAGVFVFLAALVIVLSPLMWTDHLLSRDYLPTGCQVTTPIKTGQPGVARCPIWVRW
jgi:hypothetical protein